MTSRPAPSRRRTALAVAAVLLLGLAACGDDGDETTATGDEPTTTGAPAAGAGGYSTDDDGGGESDGAAIEARDFALTSITVAPGAEVRVSNAGGNPHTATADDGAFDSGTVQPGASASVTAPSEPGAYAFHCEIHSSMSGTLTVEA